MTVAVSMAKWLGVKRVALPTAGNAGGAAAAYAARAGLECFVFMPDDTPVVNQFEAHLCGREGVPRQRPHQRLRQDREGRRGTDGLVRPVHAEGAVPPRRQEDDGPGTGRAVRLDAARRDPLPHRRRHRPDRHVEGVRRAEGAGLAARPITLPRFISCQAEGCAPIVRAFEKGERFAELFPNAKTVASGLRVPVAVGDFMMLDAIRASGGKAATGREATDRRVDGAREFGGGDQHLPGDGRVLRRARTDGKSRRTTT